MQAVVAIRVSQPDATAKQLHASLVAQDQWVGTSLGDVKKAASKAAKRMAQQQPKEGDLPSAASSLTLGQRVRLLGLKDRHSLNGFHAVVVENSVDEPPTADDCARVRMVHTGEITTVRTVQAESVGALPEDVIYATSDVMVGCIPGRDYGIRAQRKFNKGELVLKEAPIAASWDVAVHLGDKTIQQLMGQLNHEPQNEHILEQVMERITQLDFEALSSREQRRWMALHDAFSPTGTKTPCNIWRSNAYGKEDAEGGHLYELMSRANHSCAPNVVKRFEGDQIAAVATKTIAKGEEVLVCYIDDHMSLSTEQRRAELRRRYNFVCTCERCSPTATS